MKNIPKALKALEEKLAHDENAWDKVLSIMGDQAREIIELKNRVKMLEECNDKKQ